KPDCSSTSHINKDDIMNDDLVKKTKETGKLYFKDVNGEKPYELWRSFDSALGRDLSLFITGKLYAREKIPHTTRQLTTVAVLTVLSRTDELRLHIQAALNVGCTPEDIAEVIFSDVYLWRHCHREFCPEGASGSTAGKRTLAPWSRSRINMAMHLQELSWLVGGMVGLGIGAASSFLVCRFRHRSRIATETRFFQMEKRGMDQRLEELRGWYESAQTEQTALKARNLDLEKQVSALSAHLEDERRETHEKIALLQDARERLTVEFKLLSESIFEEKGRALSDQNQTRMDALLNPLREQLGDFKKRVEDVYDRESRDRVALRTEITNLRSLNERIGEDALHLTQALKGNVKTMGNWGEVILERILEASGLTRGREYDTQVRLSGPDGQRYQPDVVVRLPEGKSVIVDSKVSLKAYEAYFHETDTTARIQAVKAHLASVRNHVKGLSEKHYEDLEGLNTLDFVLMFVPVEGAFLTALEYDRQLFTDAFEKNVALVSPSTLLVTLRTICHFWRLSDQNENAVVIARQAGALYDKFIGFIESLEKIGTHLDRAGEAYQTAKDRLSTGRGNLVQRAEQLRTLGAKVNKSLPEGYGGGDAFSGGPDPA
ncbi:DNA recombination protein RmuC, partial [Desulfosarcina sp. OttesenSCG-928-B08]|nr:DNA recombination protein RmuC [Desulfosarcina sp. OttesenSCG-928-B08]